MRSSPNAGELRRSLFESVLGAEIDRLPKAVREFHSNVTEQAYSGVAEVDGATTRLGKTLAKWFKFPDGGSPVPVTVNIRPTANGELWTRCFATTVTSSMLTRGRRHGRLVERFGPVGIELSIRISDAGLELVVEGWCFGILPLPGFAKPWTRASERQDALGRFAFDVDIHAPFAGRVIRYRGWLTPIGPNA
jgi:hypothetical protein